VLNSLPRSLLVHVGAIMSGSANRSGKTFYYAVRVGREPGIYSSWDECKPQVDAFSKPAFKKFNNRDDAERFIDGATSLMIKRNSATVPSSPPAPRPSRPQQLLQSLSPEIPMKRKVKLTVSRNNLPTDETVPRKSAKKRKASVDLSAPTQKRAKATMVDPPVAPIAFTASGSTPIVVYTDGACTNNGRDGAAAGIGVFFGDGDPRNISERVEGERQTNQRAELMAAIRCLEVVEQHHTSKANVELYTDSVYVVNGMNKWTKTWKAKNWVQELVNKDLWLRLDELANRFSQIEWIHVAGHSGVKGNVEADRLATAGAALPPKIAPLQPSLSEL